MHTLHSIMSRRRNNNPTILKKVRWEKAQPWFTTACAHRILLIVSSWESRQNESRRGKLIPDAHKYEKDLRRRWQGLQFSNRSLPIRGAPKTLAQTLMSLQSVFYLHHGCHPTRDESFSSDSWVFHSCRPASLWDAAIIYLLRRKGGKRGIGKRIASPPTIRLKSESGYTAFGHSDSIQASKSQVACALGISAPPQHCCIPTSFSWLRVWGGEIVVWAFHIMWDQQITMYYPENHVLTISAPQFQHWCQPNPPANLHLLTLIAQLAHDLSIPPD